MKDEGNNVCFVISPIGEANSDYNKKFKKVLDYLIKPAVKDSGYDLKVIRADEIKKPGSWVNDILKNIYNSFVVIADLTDQNPNVFYELGIRHSLSPRTILIAQSVDDIPSDLRSYRSIVYEMTLEGGHKFKEDIRSYLNEIYQDPNHLDNPVIENYKDILDDQIKALEDKNTRLNKQIQKLETVKLISEGIGEDHEESAYTKLERIFKIENFDWIVGLPTFHGLDEYFPTEEGNFRLYSKGTDITNFLYFFISKPSDLNIRKELASIRVLMELTTSYGTPITFVIASNSDLSSEKTKTFNQFNKMKEFINKEFRNLFKLELWDKNYLLKKEEELGIVIPEEEEDI